MECSLALRYDGGGRYLRNGSFEEELADKTYCPGMWLKGCKEPELFQFLQSSARCLFSTVCHFPSSVQWNSPEGGRERKCGESAIVQYCLLPAGFKTQWLADWMTAWLVWQPWRGKIVRLTEWSEGGEEIAVVTLHSPCLVLLYSSPACFCCGLCIGWDYPCFIFRYKYLILQARIYGTFLGANPIKLSGANFWVDLHKFAL